MEGRYGVRKKKYNTTLELIRTSLLPLMMRFKVASSFCHSLRRLVWRSLCFHGQRRPYVLVPIIVELTQELHVFDIRERLILLVRDGILAAMSGQQIEGSLVMHKSWPIIEKAFWRVKCGVKHPLEPQLKLRYAFFSWKIDETDDWDGDSNQSVSYSQTDSNTNADTLSFAC
jgi:hypothetical protein